MRKVPPNTNTGMVEAKQHAAEQKSDDTWAIRSYQDDVDATIWGGKDVYDIRSKSDRVALDGTNYRSW